MSANTNKKLVVIGAGESGIGAALLGQQKGWDVFVTDGGRINEENKRTLEEAGIQYEEQHHDIEKVLTANCIVKSPGISNKVEIVKKAREAGIEICSEIEFGYRYKGDSKIIGITGTNGKSTTTMLTHHILREAGYDCALVGNIGYSFAKQLATKPAAWYVMELSSFQLEDIQNFRPDIAILLNITPDHLDRYNYDIDNYVAAKFNITKFQTNSDYLILNQDDPYIRKYLDTHSIHAKKIFITMNEKHSNDDGAFVQNDRMYLQFEGEEMSTSIHDLSIRGKHNQFNSMAAGISARIAGIRREKIRESFAGFKGLEHRLEYVATVRGVHFINDSKATNVNAVWYALEEMNTPTILILGGQDKGNDYSELSDIIREKVKGIVCLGIDNSAIHDAFKDCVPAIVDVESAREAVLASYAMAEKGDTVLLSPGCASFDRFKNYEDRGLQFIAAVNEL